MAATDTVPAGRFLPVRRLLRRTEAAAYCGVSATTFDRWIAEKRMPAGVKIDGCVLWDVRALDDAVDRLFYGAGSAMAEFEEDDGGWGP